MGCRKRLLAYMSNPEQTRLLFIAQGSGARYVDLAACMTSVHHKQYHQVERNGNALCYSVSIHPASRNSEAVVSTAPNTWCTRNAVKMTVAGWKKQLKNANLKSSQLPRYGKNFRCTLEVESSNYTFPVSGREIQRLNPLLSYQPQNAAGDDYFTPYDDTGGDTIDYWMANPITCVGITDLSTGATTIEEFSLMGTGASQFNILGEYHRSRRNVETLETDNAPNATSKMMTLFSSAEEASETITEAMDDTGDNRPYSDDTFLVDAGTFSAKTSAVDNSDPEFTTSSCWPPCGLSVTAPLGLISVKGVPEGEGFYIDVHAIYEM